MADLKPCLFGETRCLCKDCRKNAAFPDCKRGYCIDCFECDQAGKQVHDVFICTGYEKRGGADLPEKKEENPWTTAAF